jgi:hypothetical protein
MKVSRRQHGPRGTTMVLLLLVIGSVCAFRGVSAAGEDDPKPILWRDPGDIARKDLRWGPGSPARAPRPPFTFLEEDTGGTKPKVKVKDARGAEWSVKFDAGASQGREVPAEIAAGRIMWALGYLVEETYLVEEGVLHGARDLDRASRVIGSDGRFRRARFEARPPDVERLPEQWTLADNPFAGSPELSGLVLLAALLNNWDLRPANTAVLRVRTETGLEDRYILSDVGTAFGRLTSGLASKSSRWNLDHYRRDRKFIVRVHDGVVELHYRPDGLDRARVPVEHARWFSRLASRLTIDQVRQALAAARASDAEVRGFSSRLMEKLTELDEAVR